MATRTTVQQVIDEFRTTYDTNVERGEAFEKLMVAYFRLDPTLAAEYDLVGAMIRTCGWSSAG